MPEVTTIPTTVEVTTLRTTTTTTAPPTTTSARPPVKRHHKSTKKPYTAAIEATTQRPSTTTERKLQELSTTQKPSFAPNLGAEESSLKNTTYTAKISKKYFSKISFMLTFQNTFFLHKIKQKKIERHVERRSYQKFSESISNNKA